MLNYLKDTFETGYTENGAVKRNTTQSMLLDLFALGGAYRNRSDEDIFNLFYDAYQENPEYALKCLFYLRNVRGGQGERNFFKVCIKKMTMIDKEAIRRNIRFIPEFGRWDDLYCLEGTCLEAEAFQFMKTQLELDVNSKTPSLLAKWLKSENTSSKESKRLGTITRKYFGLTSKQYRKILSELRRRINVVEKLMSANRWDEIEFDKIPSRAGFIYKNAFARRDIIKEKYKAFALDESTKVNASTLYPYECVEKALDFWGNNDDTHRAMVNKYWDNFEDYIKGKPFNGIVMADTSGSMWGTPMNAAVSLAMYCASKCSGPYANHFLTFSSNPYLCEIKGYDFVNQCERIAGNDDWDSSTNIEAAMDLLLNIALKNNLPQSDVPENLVIVSDMEFNSCVSAGPVTNSRWDMGSRYTLNSEDTTLFETIEKRWAENGYKMPHITFWNVDCRNGKNIPMKDNGYVNFVSGFSPVLFEQLLECKTAYDLMMEVLNKDIYKDIR